jgi:hypothetical protein
VILGKQKMAQTLVEFLDSTDCKLRNAARRALVISGYGLLSAIGSAIRISPISMLETLVGYLRVYSPRPERSNFDFWLNMAICRGDVEIVKIVLGLTPQRGVRVNKANIEAACVA